MFLKGNFLYTPSQAEFIILENQYIQVEDGKVLGFFQDLPAHAAPSSVVDYGKDIIIPAFIDLHIHAPQYINRGLGFDEELLPWLENYTFPAEAAFPTRTLLPVFTVLSCRV